LCSRAQNRALLWFGIQYQFLAMQRAIHRVTVAASRRSFHAVAGRASAVGVQRFAASQLSAPAAAWSHQSKRFNSQMSTILQRELEEEQKNDIEDEELVELTKSLTKTFKLDDQAGMGIVKMSSKFGDEVIEIEFDCQNAETEGMEMGVEDEGVDDVKEGETEESFPEGEDQDYGINFEVTIKKDGSVLLVDCLANDTLEVRNVRVFGPQHAKKDALTLYGGPKFYELDEELQSAFYEYLAERKIDDDLSYFVLAYSREKEQKEYINWLSQLHDFTK
jgi:complement component 1 Q subcomponent-binding protein